MRVTLAIAFNTFRETIRNSVLYNILLIAVAALGLTLTFGDLSPFSRVQVLTDFGLASMSITGLLLAVFIGVGMLGGEISSKTVYSVLTKQVSRGSFIVGKFLGLLSILLLNFFLIAVLFFVFIKLLGVNPSFALFTAVLLLAVEMSVIISASILFSSFTTPTLAAIFTIGFYIAGHLNNLVGLGAQQQESTIWKGLLNFLYYTLPDLEHFNVRTRLIYDLAVPDGYIVQTIFYGICYTILLLFLSMIVFSRKDL
jgi:ABC-type transport system involved in multi-copper enzyme maturation permease subunit